MHQKQRQMWEEKLGAELENAQKKLRTAFCATTAKLPKLKIAPFKGTPTGSDSKYVGNTISEQTDKRRIEIWLAAGHGGKIGSLKHGEIGCKIASYADALRARHAILP